MGARTFRVVMPDTTTCSSRPPSTFWIDTPALGNGLRSKGGGSQISIRPGPMMLRCCRRRPWSRATV